MFSPSCIITYIRAFIFSCRSIGGLIRVMQKNGAMHYVIPTEGGLGFLLGRKLVTGPHLRKKYGLDVKYVMDREHINDAPRVLKLLRMYFAKVEHKYWPIPFLKLLSINSMIYGKCTKPLQVRSTVNKTTDWDHYYHKPKGFTGITRAITQDKIIKCLKPFSKSDFSFVNLVAHSCVVEKLCSEFSISNYHVDQTNMACPFKWTEPKNKFKW